MANYSGISRNTTQLIFVPALITLAVTILRLAGELQHWPAPWFISTAGGGGAIVGIAWLPIIFGPYFALKLAGSGQGPASTGKAIGFTVLGLVIFVLAGFLAFGREARFSVMTLIGCVVMLIAACVPLAGWRALTKALLAYAYAARIPVIVVMYLAMRGQWGTHYDAVPPGFPPAVAFWPKYAELALLPQLFLWIGYTVILGSLIGTLATAVVRRGKPMVEAAPGGGVAG